MEKILNSSNSSNNDKNVYSISLKLLNLVDTFNSIDYIDNQDELSNHVQLSNQDQTSGSSQQIISVKPFEDKNKTKSSYSNFHQEIINRISEEFLNDDILKLYNSYINLKLTVANCLINQILSNSPKVDISITKFPNIKTQLYPYQINNLNWMYSIEKQIYTEEYEDISKKCVFRGGGLFDEVGMGKTLQIITLINLNKSNYKSLIKNNKIYSKASLIIVPNHLCGQWTREFNVHTINPLKIINLLTKNHYYKYTSVSYTHLTLPTNREV